MKDGPDASHRKQRQTQSEPDRRSGTTTRKWATVALVAILAATVLLRVRLLDVPLERDEGEYAYTGQLILQGAPPYEQAYTMKLPGVHAAYALIMAIFGQTERGIHTGLILINAATIVLLFLIFIRFLGPFPALVGAAAFALLSLDRSVHGFIANAEHFVILPAIAGILLLLHTIERPRYVVLGAASFLFGLSFLMKQHAALFILFGGFYLLVSELKRKPLVPKIVAARCVLFAVGSALPFALTCQILSWAGVFDKFWFWTFTYARQYSSNVPFATGFDLFKLIAAIIVKSSWAIWILSAAGLASLFADKTNRPLRMYAITFACFSFLSVCPGLYFRKHYFLLLIPAVAMFAAIAAASLHRLISSRLSAAAATVTVPLLVMLALANTVYTQREYLFTIQPDVLIHITHGPSPFPESRPIARFIRQNTSPKDTIAVLGSEPQIPFYARRRSATSFLYMYPLMEPNPLASKLQREMIAQIQAAKPEIIVLVEIDESWGEGPNSDRTLPNWMHQYTERYYYRAGVVEIVSTAETIYIWGSRALTHRPQSQHTVLVLARKTAP